MSTAYELTRCIVCGEADVRELASADGVRDEIESLWAHHSARLRPDTPPPHLVDRVAFSERPPLRVVRCTTCGLVYRNPIERPTELGKIYGDDFTRGLGFEVMDGTIESVEDRRVDAVAIWNCLDQLADPPSAIRAARTHLGAGGHLALRVPNGACYAAFRPLIDSPLSFVARTWLALNNLLGFPYRFGFTPASLARLVEQNGFEVIRIVGDVLVRIADEWTRPYPTRCPNPYSVTSFLPVVGHPYPSFVVKFCQPRFA